MKAIFILPLVMFFNPFFAQKDSIYIKKSVDEMSDEVYYFPSRDFVLTGKDKSKGIILSAFIDEKNSELNCYDLSVKMINLGDCTENSELVIMFEDSTKIKLTSWNDFNCKGNAWFRVFGEDIDKLSRLRMLKVQIQNGYTYDRFTCSGNMSDYYRQIYYAIKTNKIKRVK
jgi:hypothetical protein